jgi:NADPH-dependent 2,4-dienoyl-CoA reductase/sulfur reductase-like enzyme/ferredoxin
LGGSVLISAGLYQALLRFFDLNAYRLSALFAGLALTTFYFFAAPNALNAFTELTGYVFTPLHFKLSQFYGAGLGLILLVMGLWNQYKVKKAEHSRITGPLAMNPAASQAVKAQFKPSQIVNVHADKPILMPHHLEETPCVVDAQTGVTHAAKSGQTLLDVLEGQGHDLKACCRTGICGADPVLIKEGMNNLSEPSPEELATLRRLGLEGHGRMACSCRLISGSVTVDRRVDQLETLETSGSKAVSQKITFTQGASIPVPQERMTFLSRYTSASPYTYNPSENDKEMPELGRVIIIGNGIAGMSAADELRRLRPDVEIIVLSDEPYHFYNRMALNKVFEGLTDTDNLMMGKVEEYARKRIQIKLKSRVELIDRRRKLIRLNGGQTMLYDKLILATGASASVTHEDFLAHHNAFVLRSADDACEIRDHILNFGCEDAVVIGGGVLGVEAAEALARLGAKVTLIHRANRLMDRQLDEPSALRLAWYLEDLGVRLIMNAQIDRFEGYRHLKAVYFSDGTHISGHIFVACVGTKPNTSLAQKIGLRVQTGVLVNRYMKTSDSHIYAVGDVAELKDETSGLWAVGMMQGQVAAASITGKPMTYEAPRSFMRLKSDGLSVLTYGNVIDISPHAQVLSSPLDAPDYWCVVLEGEQVRGAVFTGPIDTPNPLEGLLGTHDQRLAVIARLRQRTHSSAHDTLAARINRGVEIEHGETTQEEYFDALSEQHIGTKLNTWGETLWNKANQSEASSVSPTIQTWPLISLPQANENPRSTF